jgi:20S proteasome alpha/beta subunit
VQLCSRAQNTLILVAVCSEKSQLHFSLLAKKLNAEMIQLKLVVAFILSLLSFLSSSSLVADAALPAASRSRRKASSKIRNTDYDRTVTTFSPKGELLQVEYALQGTRRSSSLVAMTDGRRRACVAVARGSSSGGNNNASVDDDVANDDDAALTNIAASERIYKVDEHVYIAVSGFNGDGRVLMRYVREEAQNHKKRYGERATVSEIANFVGSLQHRLTRTSGVRPFAVAATVIGFDSVRKNKRSAALSKKERENETEKNRMRIFKTDPGGMVEEVWGCATGMDDESINRYLRENFNKESSSKIGATAAATAVVVEEEQTGNDVQSLPVSAIFRKSNNVKSADVYVFTLDDNDVLTYDVSVVSSSSSRARLGAAFRF